MTQKDFSSSAHDYFKTLLNPLPLKARVPMDILVNYAQHTFDHFIAFPCVYYEDICCKINAS